MAIPTIPGTSRVPDQQIGVKRNLSVEEAPLNAARSTIHVANQAVQSMAGDVMDYEQRKQKAEEVAAFNQAAITINKVTSGYRDAIRHYNTEQQIDGIVPQWQQTAQQTKDQLLDNTKLTPVAQAKLRQHLDLWAGDSTSEFQTAADVKGSQRRRSVAITAYNEFLSTGDPAMMKNAAAAIDAAARAGDIAPEEAQFYKSQMSEKLAEAQVLNGINSDPYHTLQDLRAGKFSAVKNPARLRELTTEARERTDAVQSTNLGNYVGQIASAPSPSAYPSEDQLKSDMEAGKLSGRGYNQLLGLMKRDKVKEAQTNYRVLMADMAGVQLGGEKNPEAKVNEWKEDAAGIHDPILQKKAMDAINTQQKSFQNKIDQRERPIENEVFRLGRRSWNDGLFPSREDYGDWVDKMRTYFQNKPESTMKEAEEYSNALLRPVVDGHVKGALGLAPKPADTTQAQYEKLKKGETFWWGGKQMTKQ